MRSADRSVTADDRVDRVASLLRSTRGREELKRFNTLVVEVVESLPTLRVLRARLHQRASMQLYVNASNAKGLASCRTVSLSVRVHGVECGIVTVAESNAPPFAPSNRRLFGHCGFDDLAGREWAHPTVARYIKAAASQIKGRPEAKIESALIREMKRPGGTWREQQPVCLAGLPLQVPLPVRASGPDPELGDGHIDVLARVGRGGKRLRVYELKAPKADASGALDQAVAYVAALKFVLVQQVPTMAEAWWRLIGFRARPRRMPAFEAFACVADTPKNRKLMVAAIERLSSANTHGVVLGATYYPVDPEWPGARASQGPPPVWGDPPSADGAPRSTAAGGPGKRPCPPAGGHPRPRIRWSRKQRGFLVARAEQDRNRNPHPRQLYGAKDHQTNPE